jgi:hypothetical protein
MKELNYGILVAEILQNFIKNKMVPGENSAISTSCM